MSKISSPSAGTPRYESEFFRKKIHADHIEAHNAAVRRRNSALRRRTNTYAKNGRWLQQTFDVHQLIHNFVRPRWTAGNVPAVSLGKLENQIGLEEILTMQRAA